MLHWLLKYLQAKRNLIFFVTILIVGFCLRTYQLSSNPPGFFCDEASIGYNAFTILTKGVDEYNSPFPIFFRAFGEYKSPIQIYSTVPVIALFGLTEFAVRFTSVFYGMLSLVAIFLFARELFFHEKHKNSIGLLSMLFLAISPWAIHISRVSLEGFMPYLFFTTLGAYVFLKSQHTPKLLPLAIALFAIGMYTYFPSRAFIPLFGLGLVVLYYKFFITYKKYTLISFFILSILLIPFLYNLFSPGGFARWQEVSIFASPPQKESIVTHITINYLRHFSLDFLFLKGSIDMPGEFINRHSVRGIGELYLFQFPLLFLGVFFIWKKNKQALLVLLVWLMLYPVGSMFTTDESPQATRSLIGVIPFQIISAAGAVYLFSLIAKTKKFIRITNYFLGLGIIALSVGYFSLLYFTEYPTYAADFWGWQYGARDIVTYFATHQRQYQDFIMSSDFNEPQIFFKFYAPYDCNNCKVGLPDDSYNPGAKQLFSVTPEYIQSHKEFIYSPVKIIYYPSGKEAFVLTEVTKRAVSRK